MASWSNYRTIPGLLAGANLSSSQYKIVKFASTAGEVVAATSATSLIAGVLMNEPADGEIAEVAYQGIAKVYMTTSISAGERLGVNSSAYAASLGGTAGYTVLGMAIEGNGTSGNIKRVALSIGEK
jgi:hypothetical protein